MATPTPNQFTSYDLSEQEQIQGSILSLEQERVLQNEKASVAEQLLALKFDTLNPGTFTQDHAFLSGQLAVFTSLLETSQTVQRALLTEARSL